MNSFHTCWNISAKFYEFFIFTLLTLDKRFSFLLFINWEKILSVFTIKYCICRWVRRLSWHTSLWFYSSRARFIWGRILFIKCRFMFYYEFIQSLLLTFGNINSSIIFESRLFTIHPKKMNPRIITMDGLEFLSCESFLLD